MKKLALHWKILIGMALGVIVGLLMTKVNGGMGIVQDWIKPFGNIFINSLKLIAIPLILAALIKGVSDLKDISKLSKMGTRTILIYITTTIIAVSVGLILVNTINPGKSISEQTRSEMVENYSRNTVKYQETALKQKESGPLQALEDLVPQNIFEASTSNKNMLQVIFFAIFFGIGLILIPEEKGAIVKKFFDGLMMLY
jgi:Na+/H+-dicarboxylate symporter